MEGKWITEELYREIEMKFSPLIKLTFSNELESGKEYPAIFLPTDLCVLTSKTNRSGSCLSVCSCRKSVEPPDMPVMTQFIANFKVTPTPTGNWEQGKGFQLRESLIVEFASDKMNIMHPAFTVVGFIIMSLQLMQKNPLVVFREYWEVDTRPDGDYSQKPLPTGGS